MNIPQPQIDQAIEVVRHMTEGMWHIEALSLYSFNTKPMAIIEAVYLSRDEDYLEEKMRLLNMGIMYFWAGLDEDHRQRLFRAAWDKYGEEVRR